MTCTPTSPGTMPWAQHFAAVLDGLPQLSHRERQRLQRYQQCLLVAAAAHDRHALRRVRQTVLRNAFHRATPPALRSALRQLLWPMAALLPARQNGNEKWL